MATLNHKTTIIGDEVIERELTAEEFASIKAEQDRIGAEFAAAELQKVQQAETKAAVLAKLGLTEDELKAALA